MNILLVPSLEERGKKTANIEYRIYTDIKDQRTDGYVYFDLYWKKADKKEILRDTPIIDDNEPGTSLFKRTLPELGEVTRGFIYHRGGSDFILQQVRVEATINGTPRGWRLASGWEAVKVTEKGVELKAS